MTGRLGGTGKARPGAVELDRMHRWQLPSLQAARGPVEASTKWWKRRVGDQWRDAFRHATSPNRATVDAETDYAAALVEEAIALDPRLAKRPSWKRAEFGEFAEPSLVACGDDEPCFVRHSKGVSQQVGGQDPLTVVISTDCNKAANHEHLAAAFIAVCRLVQQFRPLDIWWQGSWIHESDSYKGFVFHVPLLTNDTDYGSLWFFLNSDERDSLSYAIAYAKALEVNQRFRGVGDRASRSYLNDWSDKFVPHTGIEPTANSIAAMAAQWLGIENYYWANYKLAYDRPALQELPPPPGPERVVSEKEKRDQDRSWERYKKDEEKRKKLEVAERTGSVVS